MNLSVQPVDPNYVSQVWPLVEPFIVDALSKSETEDEVNYNIHHVQGFLSTGAWLLIVAVDENTTVHGACTVSFLNYPMHRVAFITAIGGKLVSNQETFAQLSAVLKQRGATKIQGFARESIARLWSRYGFKPVNTLVEVKI